VKRNIKQIIQDGMRRRKDKKRILKETKTPIRNANSRRLNIEVDKPAYGRK
jgi:hypothetical protein